MIYGIGTDICDIRRIRASLDRHGERFAQRCDSSIDSRAVFSSAGYGVHSSNCITMSLLSEVWICIEISGVRNNLSPFTGERNNTPSSEILRMSPKENT